MNRRQQIEGKFLRRLVKAASDYGATITPTLRQEMKSALRSAAMVGACEERQRTLDYLRSRPGSQLLDAAQQFIVRRGVLEVLGYDNEQGGKEI